MTRTRFGPLEGPRPATTSGIASLCFVALVLSLAHLVNRWALAVYLLSFWHYYLYALAYYFGAFPLGDFKRDALVMKAVSLLALASVYVAAPLSLVSLGLVCAGFLLNTLAAIALGSDRTYYGYELADLPPQRVTAFPYSWIAHPMLVGNMTAFAGTLVNPSFRAHWWPLACLHVVLNFGLLLMELCVTPQRLNFRENRSQCATYFRVRAALCLFVILVLGVAHYCSADEGIAGTQSLPGLALGASAVVYAYVIYGCYSRPRSIPVQLGKLPSEDVL